MISVIENQQSWLTAVGQQTINICSTTGIQAFHNHSRGIGTIFPYQFLWTQESDSEILFLLRSSTHDLPTSQPVVSYWQDFISTQSRNLVCSCPSPLPNPSLHLRLFRRRNQTSMRFDPTPWISSVSPIQPHRSIFGRPQRSSLASSAYPVSANEEKESGDEEEKGFLINPLQSNDPIPLASSKIDLPPLDLFSHTHTLSLSLLTKPSRPLP